jgi:hypothetical protein
MQHRADYRLHAVQVVLVYNFFSSSTLPDSTWRTLFGFMKERGWLSADELASKAFAHRSFDAKACLRVLGSIATGTHTGRVSGVLHAGGPAAVL